MNVGILKIRLRLPGNRSLKGKRQVLRSITTRLRSQFNISVAEVDDHDLWQMASLGVCCVSNDRRYTNEVLSKVVAFVCGGRFEVEMVKHDIEIISLS